MTKKSAGKLIETAEIAKRLKRTPAAITKAFRGGRFGTTAQRGPRGELLFPWPAARDAFNANTDTTRARPEHQPENARSERVVSVVYESERGRLEISEQTYRSLLLADAQPDEPLLTAELVATLDQIMFIVGEGATL